MPSSRAIASAVAGVACDHLHGDSSTMAVSDGLLGLGPQWVDEADETEEG